MICDHKPLFASVPKDQEFEDALKSFVCQPTTCSSAARMLVENSNGHTQRLFNWLATDVSLAFRTVHYYCSFPKNVRKLVLSERNWAKSCSALVSMRINVRPGYECLSTFDEYLFSNQARVRVIDICNANRFGFVQTLVRTMGPFCSPLLIFDNLIDGHHLVCSVPTWENYSGPLLLGSPSGKGHSDDCFVTFPATCTERIVKEHEIIGGKTIALVWNLDDQYGTEQEDDKRD